MIKITRNPFRIILALVMMPLSPFLVLWVANQGILMGEQVASQFIPLLLEKPWMIVVFASMGPALVFGTIAHLFIRPNPPVAFAETKAGTRS